ncbi:hypothetical protein [Lutimonas sp.]|uniref:hypothetical protein n=1 Tax=Lutimonas sp. TaxID=1872403 RepID=UPI003D9B16F4
MCLIFLWSCGGDDSEPGPIIEPELRYGAFIDDTTYEVFATPEDNFEIAEFKLWVPDITNPVRAVAVLTHSYNSNGLGYANSAYWQEFARKESIAILAVYLTNAEGASVSYTDAQRGSGRALLNSLGFLADKIGKDYIKDLPLLLRGYSAGGVFSYSFSGFLPDRVLGFANMRGGSMDITPDTNLRIPGLLFFGELDAPQRNSRIFEVIAEKRLAGANWSLILEPDTDHFGGLDAPEAMIQMFFSEVLEKRLLSGSNTLADIPENSGWLGDNVRGEIYSFDQYPYDKTKASWLLSEEFAKQWLDFQR